MFDAFDRYRGMPHHAGEPNRLQQPSTPYMKTCWPARHKRIALAALAALWVAGAVEACANGSTTDSGQASSGLGSASGVASGGASGLASGKGSGSTKGTGSGSTTGAPAPSGSASGAASGSSSGSDSDAGDDAGDDSGGADSQTLDSSPEGSGPSEASVYGIGGQLAGLTPGESITLQNNLGDNLTVSSNGTFAFPTAVVSGGSYAVTILTSPSSPIAQTCSVSNASGTVQGGSVTNIAVHCDLLAYFPFSGNANDASGYGHNGIVTGASLTTDRNGKANSAYAFAGSGNIQAAMPTGFLPSGDAARTLTAWLEPTQSQNIDGLAYWGTGNCNGLMFGIGEWGGNANFWGGCDDYESGLTIPVSNTVWTFVAIVYSPTTPTTITFYVNDLSTTGTVTALVTPDVGDLVMGADLVSGPPFMGNLGTIRVYGRALNAVEVKSIFTSSAP
jgi:hypothetical protein